ncbi:GDSL esterase/lipase [Rhynchospora pubera]|uniref:GDSL esterase/lipase n=1 Tax=Rhynchospora pubera TaxID=906938 RepID=A0AAV8FI27_9POAL|nr:GDSL esterase/lipase [Rhynchospora pubera]KAJ4792913.1 GDSL esterase/lipase [Rhynchospora pubera]
MAISAAILAITVAFAISMLDVAAAAGAAGKPKGPVVYVFGDSMSDVGNNNYLPLCIAKSDYPWYGIDYYTGWPTGRFTNGRTIGDVMSAKFGVPSQPPYLSLYMTDDAILEGVNFASGGAGILNETGIYFVQYLSFDAQIDAYETVKEATKAKIGDAAAEKLANEALFLIGLGSNDYVNNFMRPFMADGIVYTHDEFVVLLTTTLRKQLKRLYSLGARKIAFTGLAPMGCIPSQRVLTGTGKCLTELNEYVLVFNAAAKKMLDKLNEELPGSHVVFADSYSVVMDLIDHPEKYGFKISTTSCCNVDTTVGGLCLPNARVCANRKDYVFWDAYHTSDAANQVIADKMFDDLKAVVDGVAPKPSSAPVHATAPAPAPQK